MERRHDPATSSDAPGLVVAPHSAVSPYPPAAILTAWANAGQVGHLPSHRHTSQVRLDEPVLPAAAEKPFWPQARLPLGQALAAIPDSWWPARCCLPVPGDPGGLPAGAPRALSAGQAVVWSQAGESLVLSPLVMPGGDRMWLAEQAATETPHPGDQRDATREIMHALERCVTLAESSLLPRQLLASAAISQVSDLPVPLPPGAEGTTVALARQSATVVAIVSAAMASLPETSEAHQLREALVPLGRAARVGLSVAFSQPPGR